MVTLGLAIRLVILMTSLGQFDGDEAVTGVMAQRILHGDLPLYFGVQSYQGALEQYMQAPLLALLPDTPLVLRLVQLVLTGFICVLVFVLGTRVVGSRWAGVLAALIYSLGPYYNALKGVRTHGGYDGAITFGLLAVLLALGLRREGAHARWTVAGMGVFTGLAIWENYQSAYLLVPAILWALGSARGSLARLLPAGVAGLVVGLAPVIAFRVIHGLNPPSGTGTPPHTGIADRLDGLLSPVLGQFLGPGTAQPSVARFFPAALATMIALAVFGAALWTRRRGIWALLTLRRDARRPIDLLLVGFLFAPILYAASSYTWLTGEPRYLYTLYPFLAVGLAAAVFALHGRVRWAVGAVLVGLSALLMGLTMKANLDVGGPPWVINEGTIQVDNMPAVADAVAAKGIKGVYTDYWEAYPLQFAAGDRFAVSPYTNSQFPALDKAVADVPDPGIVSVTQNGAALTTAMLKRAGSTFRRQDVGGFSIFWNIKPPWRPPPA